MREIIEILEAHMLPWVRRSGGLDPKLAAGKLQVLIDNNSQRSRRISSNQNRNIRRRNDDPKRGEKLKNTEDGVILRGERCNVPLV